MLALGLAAIRHGAEAEIGVERRPRTREREDALVAQGLPEAHQRRAE